MKRRLIDVGLNGRVLRGNIVTSETQTTMSPMGKGSWRLERGYVEESCMVWWVQV